jgi:hypothetical protein
MQPLFQIRIMDYFNWSLKNPVKVSAECLCLLPDLFFFLQCWGWNPRASRMPGNCSIILLSCTPTVLLCPLLGRSN